MPPPSRLRTRRGKRRALERDLRGSISVSYSASSLNRKTIMVLSLKGALFLIPSVSPEFNITISSNINRSSP